MGPGRQGKSKCDSWDWVVSRLYCGIYLHLLTVRLLGPVMGPVCGGWMSQAASWRWACWVPVRHPTLSYFVANKQAIAGTVLEIIATLFFRETHVPVLLKRKVAKLPPPYYTVLDFEEHRASLLRASARPRTLFKRDLFPRP